MYASMYDQTHQSDISRYFLLINLFVYSFFYPILNQSLRISCTLQKLMGMALRILMETILAVDEATSVWKIISTENVNGYLFSICTLYKKLINWLNFFKETGIPKFFHVSATTKCHVTNSVKWIFTVKLHNKFVKSMFPRKGLATVQILFCSVHASKVAHLMMIIFEIY